MAGIYEKWLADIPQQFHGKKNIDVLLRAFSRQMDEIAQVFDDLKCKVDLDSASGVNLDRLGGVVNLSRKEAASLNKRISAYSEMTDDRYRQYLRYQILSNTSNCTYQDLIDGIYLLWRLEKVHYTERLEDPATIVFRAEFSVDEADAVEFYPELCIRPSGVGIYLEKQYSDSYEVDVDFETAGILYSTEYYTRETQARLYLDGKWKLNGTRKLNGYASDKQMDCYPIQLTMQSEARHTVSIQVSEFSAVGESTQEIQIENATEYLYDGEMPVEISCGITFRDFCVNQISTEGMMTKIKLLDGKWVLNGTKKLDGGPYALE